jgi:hypothetical protein
MSSLPSLVMKFERQRLRVSKTFAKLVCIGIIAVGATAATDTPVSALNIGPTGRLGSQAVSDSSITQIVVRRGAVVRPGYAGGGVRWARPGWYRWPAGGAIAAGAAIGFVAAASAAAYAGAPPAPGMCWYYTDPSRTQGFWDSCP